MKTSDFSFELPERLIAQYPPEERGRSRLMLMDRGTGRVEHRTVRELPSLLESGTLMVFNDSRVRKARLTGVQEASAGGASAGAEAEFLLLDKIRPEGGAFQSGTLWRAMVRRAKRRRAGSRWLFADGLGAEIAGEDGEFRLLRFDRPVDDAWLDVYGHVPLPPYIRRKDTARDSGRYQTVYAREHGSAAAPTAGLHFTGELLAGLERAGIETAFITLHVGVGTFLPVRTEDVEAHKTHEETYTIGGEAALRVEKARAEGRKVLAVGTTSARALESAWTEEPGAGGGLRRGEGRASIFIYPGYVFKAVDALFTNFHTPGSTLLMLVSAFAGRDFVLECYREAVREGYRFFSYGDACLIL
jgi:S-adenosylmethionine:tRNA ribosyltransferase-isomerase